MTFKADESKVTDKMSVQTLKACTRKSKHRLINTDGRQKRMQRTDHTERTRRPQACHRTKRKEWGHSTTTKLEELQRYENRGVDDQLKASED